MQSKLLQRAFLFLQVPAKVKASGITNGLSLSVQDLTTAAKMAKKENRKSPSRQERAALAQETLGILDSGTYRTNTDDKLIDVSQALKNCVEGSVLFDAKTLDALNSKAMIDHTKISVTNEKVLGAAERLIVRECQKNVAILNFASALHPGGGFLEGAMAQEESIACASGLYASLVNFKESFYKDQPCGFYRHDMIYSPQVPVIRDAETGRLIPYYLVDVLTSPAVNANVVKQNQPDRLDAIPGVMEKRIDLLLKLASNRGANTLVLGPWGCGAFGNDPNEVADWFKKAISRHDGFVEHVVFACYGEEKNLRTFVETFSDACS